MNELIPTYMEVIAENFPELNASSAGDGTIYSSIVVDGALVPAQADLDPLVRTMTQQRVWKAIQVEREVRSQQGGYKVGANWYHSDQTSRTQQIALVILGANLPAGIMWKTMAGNFVTMTPTLASQIFQTAVGSDQAIFGRAEQHRAAMMGAAIPHLYDFSSGWPQTYEESLVV